MNAAEQIVEALLEDERIVKTAIRFNGTVVPGANHGLALLNAASAGVLAPLKINNVQDYDNLECDIGSLSALYRMPIELGFVTDTGRFVDRVEAYKIASPEKSLLPGALHSSDIPESTELPEFRENLVVHDCVVSGQPAEGAFVIYEFSSKSPGKGNAAAALAELKRTYGYLAVTDIGYPGDSSYSFWKHMLSRKLVDEVNDDQGVRHTDASTMSDAPVDEAIGRR